MPGSSRGATGVHVCRPRRVRGRTGGVACDVLRRRPRRPDQVGGPRGARASAQDRLVDDAFEEHRAEIQDALDELHQGLDRYDDEMGPHVDAAIDGLEQLAAEEKRVRDECGIRERRDRVEGVVDRVDHRAVVAGGGRTGPRTRHTGVDDPILDTRRSFLEQLNAYKRHNMRSGSDDTSDGTDDSEE